MHTLGTLGKLRYKLSRVPQAVFTASRLVSRGPSTTSPEYIQLARYVLQKWADSAPIVAQARTSIKRKVREPAEPVLYERPPPLTHNVAMASSSSISDKATVTSDPATSKGARSTSASGNSDKVDENDSAGKRETGNSNMDSRGMGMGIPSSVGQIPIAGHSSGSGSGSSSSSGGPGSPRRDLRPDPRLPPEPNDIYRLMNDERLFVKGHAAGYAPKEIIVLCHGLYGFSTSTPIPLFPSLKLHYWKAVLEVLRDRMGAKVLVVGVNGTGSIKERAEQMHEFLRRTLPKGTGVNFVAHSMGGLDVRHLISTIKPTTYTPLSLTTIGTPHRGSPFMDWCAANIGVGSSVNASVGEKLASAAAGATSAAKATLPYSLKSPILSRPPGSGQSKESGSGTITAFTSALTAYLLNIFDTPAYSNLTTTFLRDHFNPANPDSPNVKYTSVAGRTRKMSVLHPLWFPKLVVDGAAENGYAEDFGSSGAAYEGNDGLVSVSSAKWGEFIGAVDPCHHWDLRGEGGLFPSGGSLDNKPQGRPDHKAPGGWDWSGSLNHELGSELGLGASQSKSKSNSNSNSDSEAEQSSAMSMASGMTDTLREHASTLADTVKDINLSIPSFSDSSSSSSSSSSSRSSGINAGAARNQPQSSWDLAQVGQVVDWVKDIIPGNIIGSNESESGRKSMADAKKEKMRDEAEREREREGGGESRGGGQVDRGGDPNRRQMDKFDLARFYGGLMLKLRDDGY